MIHQFIFAAPKPGLEAGAFQSYWVNFHAVDYAAKIPQIRAYLVAPRLSIPEERGARNFEGVAEIWLESEQEQLASLQTREFLEGARADEPRWAAFWQTLVLDTDPTVIRENSDPTIGFTKVYALLKRRPEMELEAFHHHILATHTQTVLQMPGLQRYLIGFSRQNGYGLGEPRFDAVEVWSFRDSAEAQIAMTGEAFLNVKQSWQSCVDSRYWFTFVGQENWIVRPGTRA